MKPLIGQRGYILEPDSAWRRRVWLVMARTVPVVLAMAFVVSVVHYVDNFRFDAYAKNPDTPILVPVGWVVFTAAGVCGYLLFRRGRTTAAARCLALYALSGLIGIGHYRDAPPTAFDPIQNVFIVTDIVLGLSHEPAVARAQLGYPQASSTCLPASSPRSATRSGSPSSSRTTSAAP